MRIEDWFLTAAERGNPAYTLPDWSTGNAVVAHVHGAAYFARLVDVVSALEQDDQLYFTDWRGDADERLRPEGPTVGTLFGDAAKRGVVVKGLIWRSHHDELSYSEEQNRHLGDDVSEAGGEVLLDQRVRRAGSHHQKMVVRPDAAPGGPTSRSPGASTCATPAATTPTTTATRRSCRWRRSTASTRPGTTSSWSCAARSSGCSTGCSASAGPTRARSTPTTRSPTSRTGSGTSTSPPDPLPAQPPDPPDGGPVRGPGAAHLPRDPAEDAVRPARRALGGPRLRARRCAGRAG